MGKRSDVLHAERSGMLHHYDHGFIQSQDHWICSIIDYVLRGKQYEMSENGLKNPGKAQKAGGRISMCRSVYDNPHMERLNGTIKNDYLIPLGIDTFDELKQKLPIVINRYNSLRPHSELNRMTPAAFEQSQSLIPLSKRKQTVIKSEIFTTHSN